MHDLAHIDLVILGARPKAVAALLRRFRDLDTAEEAFQEACLRALKTWPQKGTPRDPTAWLITVGRNAVLDAKRRDASTDPLPDADSVQDTRDDVAPERLDESHYRDDVLRLLFVCGHSTLSATQQIALALRIVSGLTVEQIAKAFAPLPGPSFGLTHPYSGTVSIIIDNRVAQSWLLDSARRNPCRVSGRRRPHQRYDR